MLQEARKRRNEKNKIREQLKAKRSFKRFARAYKKFVRRKKVIASHQVWICYDFYEDCVVLAAVSYSETLIAKKILRGLKNFDYDCIEEALANFLKEENYTEMDFKAGISDKTKALLFKLSTNREVKQATFAEVEKEDTWDVIFDYVIVI